MDSMLIPTFLCPKAWEGMPGNETTRFCPYCKKHVHNLDAMAVSERLALLCSPAAKICSRYKVAIRRPAKGREESYRRRMLKHGASVALAGSVLLVLWEMHERQSMRTWYRAAAGVDSGDTACGGWPPDLYEEHEVALMGAIALPDVEETEPNPPDASQVKIDHVDLNFDPAVINKLIEDSKQPVLPPKPIVRLLTD